VELFLTVTLIGFLQQLNVGVERYKFIRWQLQPVFEADDVIGSQDDVDPSAAFGETVDALVAPEFEPVVQAELHRLDAGFVFAV
jgi:hypothetical protein